MKLSRLQTWHTNSECLLSWFSVSEESLLNSFHSFHAVETSMRFPPARASLDRRTQQILTAQGGREDMKHRETIHESSCLSLHQILYYTPLRLHGLSYSSSLSESITSSHKEKEHALEKNKCESASWAQMNGRSLQKGFFFLSLVSSVQIKWDALSWMLCEMAFSGRW